MKNLLLIVNPVSGRQHIQSQLFDITTLFNGAGYRVITFITQYRGHATELAYHAYEQGQNIIVCCGGDGTLNEVISGLIASGHSKDLKLGYIPCGSTNDFADTLGLNSDALIQAERIINHDLKQLDVGQFNNDKNFSYIASFGALSDASYSAPQDLKNKFGHFAYILEGLKDIKNIKPHYAKVIADDMIYEGEYIFASVSNTKSVAGLVKLNSDLVSLDDGKFEVILVKNPKTPADILTILHGATHSDFNSDSFSFFRAKDITFYIDEPIEWSLDGEKASSGQEVHITNINKAINLLS